MKTEQAIKEILEILNTNKSQIISEAITHFKIDIHKYQEAEMGRTYHNLQLISDWSNNQWGYDKPNDRFILLDGNEYLGREDDDNFLIITTELSSRSYYDMYHNPNIMKSLPIKIDSTYFILDMY